jgi:hypothetical protein
MPISVTFEIWSIIKLFNGDIIRQILFLSPISSKSKGIKYKHILFPKPVGKFPTTLLPFKIAEIILACSSFKLNSKLIFDFQIENGMYIARFHGEMYKVVPRSKKRGIPKDNKYE